jgi:hypothetical protein
VDYEFLPVVEQQHHDLQQVADPIRTQPQLASGTLLTLVGLRVGDQEPTRSVDGVPIGHAVLPRRRMDLHRSKCNTKSRLRQSRRHAPTARQPATSGPEPHGARYRQDLSRRVADNSQGTSRSRTTASVADER